MTHSFERNEWFTQVVEQQHTSVIRLAFTYTGNLADAEDIAQEVFLALLAHQGTFADAEHLKAWLLRVGINKAKDLNKQAWRRRRVTLAEDISCLAEEQSELLAEVLSLPEKYRLPLHLHYYEGYSIKEIAQLLAAKPATIGTRLARGRQQLRQQLGGADDGE